jgi:hypothetical protein
MRAWPERDPCEDDAVMLPAGSLVQARAAIEAQRAGDEAVRKTA